MQLHSEIHLSCYAMQQQIRETAHIQAKIE